MFANIEDIVVKTILSVEPLLSSGMSMFLKNKNCCFELFGFDIMLDSKIKPWLLEVNLSPSLRCDTVLDTEIKGGLVADMLSLIGFTNIDYQ